MNIQDTVVLCDYTFLFKEMKTVCCASNCLCSKDGPSGRRHFSAVSCLLYFSSLAVLSLSFAVGKCLFWQSVPLRFLFPFPWHRLAISLFTGFVFVTYFHINHHILRGKIFISTMNSEINEHLWHSYIITEFLKIYILCALLQL